MPSIAMYLYSVIFNLTDNYIFYYLNMESMYAWTLAKNINIHN